MSLFDLAYLQVARSVDPYTATTLITQMLGSLAMPSKFHRQVDSSTRHWEAGLAFAQQSEWRRAARSFELACLAAPGDTLFRLNWARALLRTDQIEEGVTQARLILTQEPDNLLARQLLGQHFAGTGNNCEALVCLQGVSDAAELTLDYLQALGVCLLHLHRYQEAVSVFFQALERQIDNAQCHYQLGMAFRGLGMRREASECMKTVLALNAPDGRLACLSVLAFLQRELCDWQDAGVLLRELNALTDDLMPHSVAWSSVFTSLTLSDDPERHLKVAKACANFYAQGIQPMSAGVAASLSPRLRIGFVSSDFHHHATSMLLADVLEKLDRTRFEVFLYSHSVDDGTPMRQRIEAAADAFVEIGDRSDKLAAAKIREDEITVLVDLKGYTQDTRLGIFAYRPAPVQVTYLGFPGSTGASYIDYLIGDPVVSPLAGAEFFSEKLALMPGCYQPNDQKRPLPQPVTRSAHNLPEDALVLCGFNQPHKLSPEVFDVWCALLRDLPHAVLWLLSWVDGIEDVLRGEIQERGVDPARVIFAPKVPIAEHISRFALADIYLDTWPYNGHTTASDALWAGVPVVTYAGHSFASRVAASLLHAVDLPELVAYDLAAYQSKVMCLATDCSERAAIRQHLIAARHSALLFDSDRYAKDFSDLLWRMAQCSLHGLPPEHLASVDGRE